MEGVVGIWNWSNEPLLVVKYHGYEYCYDAMLPFVLEQ